MNNNYTKASSDYAFNYTENLVEKKCDSKTVIFRILIVLLGLVLFFGVCFLVFGPVKIPHIAVVAVVLILYVCKVLWGFTKVEYESLIASGELSMDVIYAGKKRRRITEFRIHEAEAILPFADAKLDVIKTTFAVSSPYDEDAYCAIYKTEGEREALVFNASEKALKMLHYYNKATVIKK